ncbi:hypothetical protein N0V93_004469 [Gnomoniopsis smithogilvyi]|uniref:Zn(2)-C6 fungal-type domain-containing protein n=1 Tax=Gnomoniopsis smithogilvyi TaxID=1191159 RepID=A0A9W8YSQ0_9PEZI|nr:hypothetical protein N0V93_004469 [Gnomoniopsis smithogilvyi]
MPDQPIRVSQRRPRACQECTKKKIKCDKELPCARCRRLDLQCSRELVKIKSNVTQHAAEIAFLESVTSELEGASSQGDLQLIIQKLKDRTAKLQYGDHPMPAAQPRRGLASGVAVKESQEQGHINTRGVDLSLLTTLEHLAWGRISGKCFPHRGCGCQYSSDIRPTSLADLGSSTHAGCKFPIIVGVDDARNLINFHLEHLAWHHNCLHAPTFLEQCDIFWKTGQCVHPLWYALYLAVLSATIFGIQSSAKSKIIVDAGLDTSLPSALDVFTAMMDALWSGNFLQLAVLHSVQAIAISTEVAHNLGQSQLNATLVAAGIRIAESLGLHAIHDTQNEQLDWEATISREVGKRAWCQLIIQDHFAIPFTDSYVISPTHFTTPPPRNMNDDSLAELPCHLPTVSSYVRVLLEMAALMPDLQDGLGPMKQRKPLRDQYEHVLEIDARMRAIVRGFPPFLLRQDVQHEARLPWLGTARRSLAITAAEKIIMIHRPFLLRAFQMPQYNFTRRTCTAAARTILTQHEALIEANDLSIWTHTAFCITAAVVLCFEIRTSKSTTLSKDTGVATEMHKQAVLAAREHLASRKIDVLAQRGVTLIDILLDSPVLEDASSFGTHVIAEFNRVTSDARHVPCPGQQSGSHPAAMALPVFPHEELLNELENMDYSLMDFDMEYTGNEFEKWFNGIFVEV